jgi:hypothetical protein
MNDDDKDYIVVGGRNSGKLYAYYQNPNAWQPLQAKQIVTSSNYPNMGDADDAMNRITKYVADLQDRIRELSEQLDDAYIKIDGQTRFIEILQRQIEIAEKYIVNDDRRNTRVD